MAEARSWGSFYQVLESWGLVAGLRDSSAGVRLLSGDKERQGRDSSYHSWKYSFRGVLRIAGLQVGRTGVQLILGHHLACWSQHSGFPECSVCTLVQRQRQAAWRVGSEQGIWDTLPALWWQRLCPRGGCKGGLKAACLLVSGVASPPS